MTHYIGIAGTNAVHSTNRQLIAYMKQHFADQATIDIAEIGGWPLFMKNPGKKLPAQVTALAKQIEEADGVIIATPEYDHAVPAVLSSALAWLSYGIDPLAGKPVMIVGASYGSLGTSRAQAQLRQILDSPEVRASVMPSSEFLVGHSLDAFDENGDLKDPQLVAPLDVLFKEFGVFGKITQELVGSLAAIKKQASSVDWVKD
ncbi:NADPH-dependent FMN reductase [Lacticaseibacillus yichunensis]|uniref:NADPH-dependent FMN reductase n=1 Tax=Lacticaseibacillus yichunensis TaxID=2486015 RepID=A0ABW4CUM3_9LACO|nr:NADPH-dependent FMN reductase [Lacticaseibacillus yichunensis]